MEPDISGEQAVLQPLLVHIGTILKWCKLEGRGAMLLSDSSIKELINAGVLENAIKENVGPVSYDLRTFEFYPKGGKATEVELLPGRMRPWYPTEVKVGFPDLLCIKVFLRRTAVLCAALV